MIKKLVGKCNAYGKVPGSNMNDFFYANCVEVVYTEVHWIGKGKVISKTKCKYHFILLFMCVYMYVCVCASNVIFEEEGISDYFRYYITTSKRATLATNLYHVEWMRKPYFLLWKTVSFHFMYGLFCTKWAESTLHQDQQQQLNQEILYNVMPCHTGYYYLTDWQFRRKKMLIRKVINR